MLCGRHSFLALTLSTPDLFFCRPRVYRYNRDAPCVKGEAAVDHEQPDDGRFGHGERGCAGEIGAVAAAVREIVTSRTPHSPKYRPDQSILALQYLSVFGRSVAL